MRDYGEGMRDDSDERWEPRDTVREAMKQRQQMGDMVNGWEGAIPNLFNVPTLSRLKTSLNKILWHHQAPCCTMFFAFMSLTWWRVYENIMTLELITRLTKKNVSWEDDNIRKRSANTKNNQFLASQHCHVVEKNKIITRAQHWILLYTTLLWVIKNTIFSRKISYLASVIS